MLFRTMVGFTVLLVIIKFKLLCVPALFSGYDQSFLNEKSPVILSIHFKFTSSEFNFILFIIPQEVKTMNNKK